MERNRKGMGVKGRGRKLEERREKVVEMVFWGEIKGECIAPA